MLIASGPPASGVVAHQTIQIVEAIRYLLEQSNFKAGDHNVAYQSCDDATAQAGKWDSGKCSTNAQAYAGNEKVVGVIGTFNSGCAAIDIPVLNQAPGGGVAMMSPANTYVCLTEGGPGCDAAEPDKYYPPATRNYARVVANDAYQGAAVPSSRRPQGVKSVFILNDKEAYGLGVATNFRNAAENVGIKVAGFAAWDPKASSYEALFNKIKGTGADAVFLGGLIDENGAQVIKDKVAVLGPNDGAVKLFVPDGFTTQETIDRGPEAAPGMFLSVAGVPIDQFKGQAARVHRGVQAAARRQAVDPYAIYGAQAAEVMLNAIEASDGSRARRDREALRAEDRRTATWARSRSTRTATRAVRKARSGFTIYKASGQARSGDDDLPEAGGRRGSRGRGAQPADEVRGRALALPRPSFRFLPSWPHRPRRPPSRGCGRRGSSTSSGLTLLALVGIWLSSTSSQGRPSSSTSL